MRLRSLPETALTAAAAMQQAMREMDSTLAALRMRPATMALRREDQERDEEGQCMRARVRRSEKFNVIERERQDGVGLVMVQPVQHLVCAPSMFTIKHCCLVRQC